MVPNSSKETVPVSDQLNSQWCYARLFSVLAAINTHSDKNLQNHPGTILTMILFKHYFCIKAMDSRPQKVGGDPHRRKACCTFRSRRRLAQEGSDFHLVIGDRSA